MSDNYYEILELEKSCNNEDIFTAYKRLALAYNPKSNSSKDFAVNNYQFHKVTEAFIVLSNAKLRGVYDIYDHDGLKNGVKDKEGNLFGGFKYSGNAFQIFEKFFGTVNPYGLIRDGWFTDDEHGSMFGNGYGGLNQPKEEKVPDVKVEFLLSLEEIYKGGIKKVSYIKQFLNEDKRTTTTKECFTEIEIFPGIPEGKEFVKPLLGNEAPGRKSSDLIITVRSKPHNRFKRNSADLLTYYTISLSNALNSTPITINTLDDRRLDITIDEIISPQTVKIISIEGLPVYEEQSLLTPKTYINKKKGDLFLKFNIIFPTFIPQEVKDELSNLLMP